MADLYGSITAAITIFLICAFNYFSSKKDRSDLDERATALINKQAEIASQVATVLAEHITSLKAISNASLEQLREDLAQATRDRNNQTIQLRQLIQTANALKSSVAENTSVTKATLAQAVDAKEVVAALKEDVAENTSVTKATLEQAAVSKEAVAAIAEHIK
jgi:predicted  nucleic acid-binding Zn-ribbon protein